MYFASPLALRYIEVPLHLILFTFQKVGKGAAPPSPSPCVGPEFLFLTILRTKLFSHHLSKCDFILNFDFSAFLYISKTAQKNFFKTSSHNLHDVYGYV